VRGKEKVKPISKTTLGLLLVVVCLATALGVVVQERIISHTGTVKFVGNFNIFTDSSCTTVLTSVNWGQLNKGGTYEQTFYVKNTGASGADTLYIWWSITGLPAGFTFTTEWDGSLWEMGSMFKKSLTPDTIKPIKFVLVLASDVPAGGFSYQQTFTGEDVP
jgi:hypothetical protein